MNTWAQSESTKSDRSRAFEGKTMFELKNIGVKPEFSDLSISDELSA
jgi:hypothetical protein